MMKTDERAVYFLERLENAGFEAYLVGGCVRDTIMGRKVNDIDITTNGLPEQVMAVFDGDKIIPTGIKHGTVTVIHNGVPAEITTFRVDGDYSDSRRPDTVCFTSDLKEDLARRDFTMNAVAMDINGVIHDPFGGRDDIEKGIIRCVGDPVQRFGEDALRIMRAVRFSAVLGFGIEAGTADAVFKLRDRLANISVERVRDELLKLISGENCVDVMLEYREIMAQIIPELRDGFDFQQHSRYHKYDVYEHIVRTVGAVSLDDPDFLVLRTTMLLHDIGKPRMYCVDENGVGHFKGHAEVGAVMAREIMRRLRFDNKTIDTVYDLVAYHSVKLYSENDARKLISVLGYDRFMLLMRIKKADNSAKEEFVLEENKVIGQLEEYGRMIGQSENSCLYLSQLAVNGCDIRELGFSGKQIGICLDRLLEKVIDEELPNERQALLDAAVEMEI